MDGSETRTFLLVTYFLSKVEEKTIKSTANLHQRDGVGQDCSSFASLWFAVWHVRDCKCAAMCGWGCSERFLFSFSNQGVNFGARLNPLLLTVGANRRKGFESTDLSNFNEINKEYRA
jgi:hypothetical protein